MKDLITGKSQTNTKILTFSRRRGRPKNNRPQIDTGTPETVMKRLLGVTTEALDLCLEREIITKKQHWCGIHLRWLYTLRYGIPNVRATDLSFIGNHEYQSSESEDPLWRSAREKEYNAAIDMLTKSGHALLVMNLCIYNDRPKFLDFASNTSQKNTKNIKNAKILREGLDILAILWKYN